MFPRGFAVVLVRDDACLFLCELSILRNRSGRSQSVLNAPSGGRNMQHNATALLEGWLIHDQSKNMSLLFKQNM